MGFLDRLLGRTKQVAEGAADTAGDVVDKGQEAGGKVVEGAGDVADKAKDVAGDAADKVTGDSSKPQGSSDS